MFLDFSLYKSNTCSSLCHPARIEGAVLLAGVEDSLLVTVLEDSRVEGITCQQEGGSGLPVMQGRNGDGSGGTDARSEGRQGGVMEDIATMMPLGQAHLKLDAQRKRGEEHSSQQEYRSREATL